MVCVLSFPLSQIKLDSSKVEPSRAVLQAPPAFLKFIGVPTMRTIEICKRCRMRHLFGDQALCGVCSLRVGERASETEKLLLVLSAAVILTVAVVVIGNAVGWKW